MFFRRPTTIRFQLTCLVAAAVLPVWLLSGFLIFYAYCGKRDQVNATMLDTARSLTMVVDRELTGVQAALLALATSPSFAAGDFASVHRQALQLLKSYPEADIVVADATGQQLVNSFRPYGTPLPRRKDPVTVRRIFESGKPVVSDLFYGAVTKRPLIGIDVPVVIGGRVAYDLAMTFPSDRLAAILARQSLPPNQYGSILDSREVLVARSRFSERFVGRTVAPSLREAMRPAFEGTVEMARNLEGEPVFVTFSRSALSGWSVVVGVSRASVMAELYRWIVWAVLGVALISLFGIALALSFGRRIARSIHLLVEPAVSIGCGGAVPALDNHPIKETGAVAAALVQASQLLQTRHGELQESERRYSSLFANKLSGMAHCRVVTDEQGRPVDYWILRVNEAYERIFGIKKADIEGRKVTEAFPGVEHFAFDYRSTGQGSPRRLRDPGRDLPRTDPAVYPDLGLQPGAGGIHRDAHRRDREQADRKRAQGCPGRGAAFPGGAGSCPGLYLHEGYPVPIHLRQPVDPGVFRLFGCGTGGLRRCAFFSRRHGKPSTWNRPARLAGCTDH